ncbi:MAG: nucleotidyltransferase family protein [Promethearchaeia archaeon]
MSNIKAIILCAGYGTRMEPYTHTYQKTMIPLHGKPLLEYIIDGIKYAGITSFILVVGYKKEQIIEYFGDGSSKNLSIEYVEQKNLNGTGGAVMLCEDLIREDHFFLTWGDILVSYDVYKQVYETYKQENVNFILTTNYLEDISKGCAIYCEGDYCIEMIEKPDPEQQSTNLSNCGIFILSTEIFKELKKLKPSDRGELELPVALRKGIKERNWRVRIIRLKKGEFRGDFGDKAEYERLRDSSYWLRLLKEE